MLRRALLMVAPPPPSGFSPLALFTASEQGGYYDPSVLSSVWADTAGTTPAGVGDPVARLNDLSGRGNHLTQSNSSKRPTLQIEGGRHYLDFNGTTHSMSTSVFAAGAAAAQIFAGLRKAASTTRMIAEFSPDASTPTNTGSWYIAHNEGANMYASIIRGSANPTSNQITRTTNGTSPETAVISVLARIEPTNSGMLRRNGVNGTPSQPLFGTGNFGSHALFLGARNNSSLFFEGRVYAFILRYGPDLSAETIADVEVWVAEKAGVSIP